MSQANPQLREFVIRGQKVELLRYLEGNPNAVNDQDQDGVTLLMEAAANNHINILVCLLEFKAEPNVINQIGRSALMEAACRGHPAIALRLCQVPNIDFNRPNEKHSLRLTSLMEAASRGHSGVVFWLCEAKADINAKNPWNDTALTLAAHNNRFDCVKALVAQGANIDHKGDGDRTALEIAAARGYGRIVEFLSSPSIRSPSTLSQLCSQIKQSQKQILQEEVNYDASVLSRTFPPLKQHPLLPAFSEAILQVWIPPNRGLMPHTDASGQTVYQSHATNSDQPYPTAQLKYNPQIHRPRKVPFSILPRFGSCSWVAITSKRHEKERHQAAVARYRESASFTNFPLLTLYDDGRWGYKNDSVSGELNGTYTVYQTISHGTLQNIANIPHNPLSLINDFDDNFTKRINQLSTVDAKSKLWERYGEEQSDYFDQLEPFTPEYSAEHGQHIYHVSLRTGGTEVNGSVQVLQTVDFYLGKEIALGQLVMTMCDSATPWWVFEDPTQEAEDLATFNYYSSQSEAQQQQGEAPTSTTTNNNNDPTNNTNSPDDPQPYRRHSSVGQAGDNLSINNTTPPQTNYAQSTHNSPHTPTRADGYQYDTQSSSQFQ